ncbi:MAG: hypothetical protein Q9222_007757 [Ikaeria aurantiellina]
MPTIRDEGKIYTAAKEGKVPFISAEDIAGVAYRGLVDEKSHDCDHVIVGPENLTYGQLAETLTSVLGRPIEHVNYTEDQVRERLVKLGLNEGYAKMLSALDTSVSQGKEELHNDVVEKVTGRRPLTFKEFAEKSRDVWQKA